MKRFLILALVLGALVRIAAAEEAEQPAGRLAILKKMQAFKGFVGTWKVETTTSTPAGDQKSSDETVVEYTLEGRYVQATSKMDGKISCIQMGTYDQDKGCYRWWSFNASGDTTELKGEYDTEKKEFKWKGTDSAGNGIKKKDTFPDKNTFTFTVLFTPAEKTPKSRINGKATRK